MSNTKHTPGPWEIYGEAHSLWDIVVNPQERSDGAWKGYMDCDKIIAAIGPGDASLGDEEKANARLIAAAPEMLEGCKQAEKWLEGWASAEPYLTIIRAAIAKAEGKNP